MTQQDQKIFLSFSSSFEFMDTVHDLTNEVLASAGFNDDDRYWLTIAVREAITNAVKHGNRQDPGKLVDVEFQLNGEELRVTVRDHGEGFDVGAVPDPRLPENLLKDKGRGIYYIRTFMDRTDYDIVPGRGTTVTMVKRLPR
jgi:serine/threonine-protein kinase RsbW